MPNSQRSGKAVPTSGKQATPRPRAASAAVSDSNPATPSLPRTSSSQSTTKSSPSKSAKKKLALSPAKSSPARRQPQESEEETTPPSSIFPNLSSPTAVQRAWNSSQLKEMLTSVGKTSEGSKTDLADRLIKAAKIKNIDSLVSSDIPKLSDLQVAFALQQLGMTLLSTPRERRRQLVTILDEQDPPTDAVDVDSFDADLENLRKQLKMKDDEIQRLKSFSTRQRSSAAQADPADVDHEPTSEILDSSTKSLQLMASSIASAITDGLASANDSTSGVAVAAKIDRTHPALIDPRNHGNDPHKFGLLIKRMIDIDYSSAGLAGIAWRHTFKTKALQIQAMVHAEAPHNDYIEGESEFISLVNQCVTLAIEHDKDAAKYATLRSRQLAWWFDSFNTIKQDLRASTRFWSTRKLTFRMQMEDLICTAIGLGFTNSQLRNMKASLKLRAGFTNGNSDDEGGHHDNFSSGASRSEPSPGRKRSLPDFGSLTDRDPPLAKKGRLGGAEPSASETKKFTGQRMPLAKSIVGASTPGAADCDATCEICGIGGTPDTGHRKFECPVLFSKEYPGKSMPGFNRSGVRIASMWEGANITASMRAQWLRLHSLGYFTQPPFRKNPDQVPVMRG